MIPNLGDFAEDTIVYIMFNTFSSNDPSASCTIMNFANTDVHIHKDDGLAQRNNAAGITVSIDFDGITGSHMIKIDTSDDTVAGFWVTGKDYFVRIEGTTIDGGTVNAVVGRFSIENRFNEVDVVKWLGQACAAVTVNGVPEVDITHLLGTAWLAPGVAGTPDVNVKQLGGTAQTGRDVGANVLLSSGSGAGQLDFTSGVVKSNLAQILGTVLTETAGWLAAGFKKLFNVATPVLVASDVMRGTDSANTVVPDAAGVAPTVGEIRTEMEGAGTKLTLVLGDTNELQTNQGNWITATGFNTVVPDAAGVAATPAEVATALTNIDLDHLIQVTAGAEEPIDGSYLDQMMHKSAGQTFDATTDSLEAIRDRGDAAWTTGGGGSISDILNVQPLVPNAIDLANTATVRIALGLTNMLDDLPTTAEIIPGTITIDRKAIGGTSWSNIVNAAACSELAGLIYYDEVFDSGTGYVAGDTIRITFKSQKITVAANDYEITGTDGWVFHTYIREAMRGTNSAALASVCTEARLAELDAANLSTDIANVKTDTAAILVVTGTDGVVVASGSKIGYALSSTGADLILKNSTFALALADAVCDEVLTGATHNVANSLGRRIREIGAFAIHSGTAQAGASNSITLAATADANDGIYNRNLIVLVDNTGVGQTRTIADYNGTTKVAVIDREWRVSPDNTTVYQVTPDDTPLVVDHGVAQAGSTSTTIKLRAYASAVNDVYLCNIVAIIAGTGRGQARLVGAYNGTTKVVTICGDNWIATPDNTSVYVMIPYGTTCASCVGDHALSQINTEMDNVLDTAIPGSPTADSINEKIKTLPSGIAKNVLLNNFEFLMVLSSDHISPATGKTVACQRSIDGAAFANCNSATATEVSAGVYKLNLAASDLNGDVITLKFSEASCDTTIITIKTES